MAFQEDADSEWVLGRVLSWMHETGQYEVGLKLVSWRLAFGDYVALAVLAQLDLTRCGFATAFGWGNLLPRSAACVFHVELVDSRCAHFSTAASV